MEKENKLIELFRSLESEKCKEDLIFYAESMCRMQNAIKADYADAARKAV